MAVALAHTFIAAYLSNLKESRPYQLSIALLGLCIPAVVAHTMIFGSGNGALIQDFWHRLLLLTISPFYLMIILLLMPLVLFVATGLSLLFGYSAEQFSVTKEFTAMKGSAVLGMLISIALAHLNEHIPIS